MTSPRGWWRRAAEAIKDRRSICLTMVSFSRHGGLRSSEIEAAVIRATSHSDRSVDYKNARRIFALARDSPSFMSPLMRAVARRADRTRSWPVALKCLLLTHGLLLVPSDSGASCKGRLPFDLSDFHDRDSSNNSWGFSALVRAYFHFLDNRAMLLSVSRDDDDDDCGMSRVDRLQTLLDLLMRIRPCADGMDAGLVLEAMDCAVIEIFEVYSGICNGVASFLLGVFGSSSKAEEGGEERKRKGLMAIRVLKRASEQSWRLTKYFEACRSLGVLNAAEFPPVDRVPDEDIADLERLVHCGVPQGDEREEEPAAMMGDLIQLDEEEEIGSAHPKLEVVITKDWVVFEDEFRYHGNPFLCSPAADRQWASMVHCNVSAPWSENLIELT